MQHNTRDNPDAALATVPKLSAVIERLEDFPFMGRSGDLDTREIVATPFVIVYCLIDDVINIKAIFHGSRR